MSINSCTCSFNVSASDSQSLQMDCNQAVKFLMSLSKEKTVSYILCKKEETQLYQTFHAEPAVQAAEKIYAFANNGKAFPKKE